MQKRFYYIFGGTDNRNTEPEDYNMDLYIRNESVLNDILDIEPSQNPSEKNSLSMEDKDVPIYLDNNKRSRTKVHKITWQDLNKRISELKYEVKNVDDPMHTLISNLRKIKNDYKKKHPTPSPNDIVTFKKEIDLLGYYTRNGRNGEPEIVLLMETLKNNKNAIATTLIHEMFHAYYDHDLNKKENILPYVEEPLTEYAMLKFVEKLAKKDKKYSKLFDDAKKMVRQKQYSLGIAHYGFGYYLWEYEQKYGASFNWIEAFRNAKYKIKRSQKKYKNYAAAFEQGIYPFWDEFRQMKLLQVLLT